MANFAERLDLALSKRGFSGAQLAAALTEAGIPITRAYVSQLRTGKQTNPTLQVLRALAACLQVSVGWLLGEDTLDSGAVEELQLRAAAIGASASGLSDGSLTVLRGVIGLARAAEGLPEQPEAAAPEIPEAAAPLTEPQREALGDRLRNLRLIARMSPEEVETSLGRGAAAIGAIEEGRVAPAPVTVERLLTLYGVTAPPTREYVLSLARGERPPSWYDAGSVPVWMAATYALEQRASLIRTYQTQVVPPLLQTEAYARAAIEVAGNAGLGQTSADAAVGLIRSRQALLNHGDGPVLWAVIDESVLLRSIADLATQAAQLDRLIEYAKRPNISLHIVPIDDPIYLPRSGSFTMWRFPEAFEPDVACAHAIDSDEVITDAAAVEAYHQAFTKLSVTTTMGDETHELLYAHRDRLTHR
ncbi:helix-turn-helix transcriptional regulator [Nonomuraea sp. NEAU-A123]|uniref:helix-turn-helix domain-containing protein n=1 Tax=Nonomuraea sp. NEAU-A123 TaxID=2839649 RepID=UPI001BE49377|nr:helix-turn-helix transcriptional regulator [Nonomuraea sp. NEAU-A123]MBT2226899.1 helix-turn-helix domain-containing protein [Nonomuraea sp. NEAU-A123]